MKKIKYLLFSLLVCVLFVPTALAASSTIGVKTSASKVVVGNTIKVTVTISSSDPLGSWEYILNYDKNLVSLTSTDSAQKIVDYAQNGSVKSKSYVYSFKANKAGNAKFSISGGNVIGWDEKQMETNQGSRTVSIITQAQLEASYSTNNNLSALGVENYSLTPEFNKDTLDYTLDVDSEIKSINITAKKEDNTASIMGTGVKELTEGINKIEVVVTSQKGTTKTYNITVNVKELNPIIVKVNDKESSIVKKSSYLTIPENYEVTTLLYHEEEIEVLFNSETKFTLIGLKDVDGNITLYKYDEDNDEFTPYKELTFNKIVLSPVEKELNLKGFSETKIKINGEELNALKYKGVDNYAVIYGIDTTTGVETYYQYDIKNNVLQIFNQDLFTKIIDDKTNYFYIILLTGGFLLLTIILLITEGSKARKLKKILSDLRNKVEQKKNELINKKEEDKVKENKDE